MINSVKRFFEIHKNTTSEDTIIKMVSNLLNDTQMCIIGRIFFPKSKLQFLYDVLIMQKLRKLIVKNMFKNVADLREQRNRPIIFTFVLIPFFEDWTDLSSAGKTPSLRDLFIIHSKGFARI